MITDGDFTDEQLLLTTVQAAKVLGISRTTLYQLIKDGALRPVHLSRSCRISWAELERFVIRLDSVDCAARQAPQEGLVTERRWRRVVGPSGQQHYVPVEVVPADGGSAA